VRLLPAEKALPQQGHVFGEVLLEEILCSAAVQRLLPAALPLLLPPAVRLLPAEEALPQEQVFEQVLFEVFLRADV
jgi:hypothetical protein